MLLHITLLNFFFKHFKYILCQRPSRVICRCSTTFFDIHYVLKGKLYCYISSIWFITVYPLPGQMQVNNFPRRVLCVIAQYIPSKTADLGHIILVTALINFQSNMSSKYKKSRNRKSRRQSISSDAFGRESVKLKWM